MQQITTILTNEQLAHSLLIFNPTNKGSFNQGQKQELKIQVEKQMAKDVITVDGEERVVREDTAKSYRGVVWALTVVAVIIGIAALMFFLFFGMSLGGNSDKTPPPDRIEQR